ncbi:MAG: hypothetical protein OEQ39_22095 [Gammaproteobacteria bacterium]|nr:hypothetical protein [Gammaproteobacteria bacterium]
MTSVILLRLLFTIETSYLILDTPRDLGSCGQYSFFHVFFLKDELVGLTGGTMSIDEWRDIFLLFAGFFLSIVAGILGMHLQRRIDRYIDRKPLSQILNFGAGDLVFVFPHRDEIRGAILPMTSTEDFLAMNNFISSLIKIDWKRKILIRDTKHVIKKDLERNLVIICSSKSNDIANEFQQQLKENGYRNAFLFASDDSRVKISDQERAYYTSRSYKQEKKYLNSGVLPQELHSKKFSDYGIVTKVTNPWNAQSKVFWIAGIRGIGTWGAAEFIKKEWLQLYEKLPTGKKDHDFSALLKIKYNNSDITSTSLIRLELLG